MAKILPRLTPTSNPQDLVETQDTEFTTDVVGRFVCNTWNEATQNGGAAFDVVVIGAGMFGAYIAEKIYRQSNKRVLVLDAGSLLVTEHVQNLSRMVLNAAGPKKDQNKVFDLPVVSNADDPGPREWVWGIPWRSQVPFPGLAYCLGGRSLYWGGWSPQLTDADLLNWPPALKTYLQATYESVEKETGVFDKTDYVSGPLFTALLNKFNAVKAAVATVDKIEEAPLAVQAAPPASGLFSFDKWSSAPIFVEAVREAADKPDSQRRLFCVPRVHVTRLTANNGVVNSIELRVNGQPKTLNISPNCAVVLASGTIESTRLAMESFPTSLMGRNLMAHLRSNTTIRIKRAVLGALPQKLQAAALLVRGSTPQGRYHLQVTAAAFADPNPEKVMWRMVPDIELLDKVLASQAEDWITIVLRGIGQMNGDGDPNKQKVTGAPPRWMDLTDQTDEFGLRRVWVNLATTQADWNLWQTMDEAALALAKKLANDDPNSIEYFYNKDKSQNEPGWTWQKDPPPASLSADKNNANNRVRDGLGTTHHEAGTLWMGDNANNSVTNLDGRFRHIANAYVAGPALFPTLGSHNPSLTGLALARRTASAISA